MHVQMTLHSLSALAACTQIVVAPWLLLNLSMTVASSNANDMLGLAQGSCREPLQEGLGGTVLEVCYSQQQNIG